MSSSNRIEHVIQMRNFILLAHCLFDAGDIRTISAFQNQPSSVLLMCGSRLKISGFGYQFLGGTSTYSFFLPICCHTAITKMYLGRDYSASAFSKKALMSPNIFSLGRLPRSRSMLSSSAIFALKRANSFTLFFIAEDAHVPILPSVAHWVNDP